MTKYWREDGREYGLLNYQDVQTLVIELMETESIRLHFLIWHLARRLDVPLLRLLQLDEARLQQTPLAFFNH